MANNTEKIFSASNKILHDPGFTWSEAQDKYGDEDLIVAELTAQMEDQPAGEGTIIDTESVAETTSPGLSRGDEILFEVGIRKKGFDVLAFYKSQRIVNEKPFDGLWGIFYLSKGIRFVE